MNIIPIGDSAKESQFCTSIEGKDGKKSQKYVVIAILLINIIYIFIYMHV